MLSEYLVLNRISYEISGLIQISYCTSGMISYRISCLIYDILLKFCSDTGYLMNIWSDTGYDTECLDWYRYILPNIWFDTGYLNEYLVWYRKSYLISGLIQDILLNTVFVIRQDTGHEKAGYPVHPYSQ